MPFGRSIAALLFVALFALFISVALFGAYTSLTFVSFGQVQIDALMYVGVFVFLIMVLAAALGFILWLVGATICWMTHFLQVNDRKRARHVIARKDAR